MNKLKVCSALIGAMFIFSATNAEELTGTLKKIKDSGTINLAYRDASIPFSYIATDPRQPIGYSHDISIAIANAVKKKLDLPDLKIKYNLVTSATRIPLVQNGTVDLECGSTTNNHERAKQVDFSVDTFLVGTRLLVNKSSGINDFPDLKGKNVVVTAGTTSEKLLKSYNESEKLSIRIISAKDHGESFLTLETGRAVAFMVDDILLYGEKTKAKRPDDWIVVGTPMSYEAYACMLRKNDPQFKELVDETIKALFASGEISKLYDRWFTQAIPPRNVNLNFPMSDDFKKLVSHPTDQPY